MDDSLTRCAEVVFVASEKQLEEKRSLRPDCVLSPHGVDFQHFNSVALRDGVSRPSDLPGWQGAIIGFFGLIEAWIDLGLIAKIGQRRPAWLIVLIGRQAVDVSAFLGPPTILMLGRKPFSELPSYGRFFDVGLLPYHCTAQVIHS